MSVEVKGPYVAMLLVLGAVAAYFILGLRLPQNLAAGLAIFGMCVVGLFVFAFRLATQDRERHGDHGHAD